MIDGLVSIKKNAVLKMRSNNNIQKQEHEESLGASSSQIEWRS